MYRCWSVQKMFQCLQKVICWRSSRRLQRWGRRLRDSQKHALLLLCLKVVQRISRSDMSRCIKKMKTMRLHWQLSVQVVGGRVAPNIRFPLGPPTSPSTTWTMTSTISTFHLADPQPRRLRDNPQLENMLSCCCV